MSSYLLSSVIGHPIPRLVDTAAQPPSLCTKPERPSLTMSLCTQLSQRDHPWFPKLNFLCRSSKRVATAPVSRAWESDEYKSCPRRSRHNLVCKLPSATDDFQDR